MASSTYLHRLGHNGRPQPITVRRVQERPVPDDLPSLHEFYVGAAAIQPGRIETLARELGVSALSLERLGIGWSAWRSAFAFPMRDAAGELLGIRLRGLNGTKYAVRGSREGLFVPSGIEKPSHLFVAEGPTDTAALLDLGLSAVGRPSCVGGAGHVLAWIRRQQPNRVTIVADRDTPGQRGASRLADNLAIWVPTVEVVTPPEPFNDVRAWVSAGCTRTDVEDAIEAASPVMLTVGAGR